MCTHRCRHLESSCRTCPWRSSRCCCGHSPSRPSTASPACKHLRSSWAPSMSERLPELADIVADPLVLGVVSGDRAAWFELTLHIEAWVEAHVPRHWRMRKARLAGSEDDVRDVLLETLERIDRE